MADFTDFPTTSVGAIPTPDTLDIARPPKVVFDGDGNVVPYEDWPSRGDTAMPPLPDAALPDRSFQIQRHTWFGTDGREWDLTNPESGVFLVQELVEGMHLPPMDEVLRESPSLAGGSFHGYRIKPRPIVWAIYIYTDDSSEVFVELDRMFWHSFAPGKYGTWRVTQPNGEYREIRARLSPKSTHSYERDPSRFGWQKYVVELIADDQPCWTRPNPIAGARTTFAPVEGPGFFGDGDGGPPFHIAASRAETSKEILNDGDEEVHPVVTINGPMDKVDLQIGDLEYHIACDLEAGEWFRIDTRPRHFSITDDQGRDRLRDVSSWIFKPLPPHETTQVVCIPSGFGLGSVIIDAAPLYHKAW